MINIKNNNNGNELKCSYTFATRDGQLFYRDNGKQPTDKFLSARGLSLTGETGNDSKGNTTYFMQLSADWSIVDAKPTRPAKPATDGAPAPKPAKPATKPTAKPEPEPAPLATATIEPTANGGDALAQLIANEIAKYLPKPEPTATAQPAAQPTAPAATINVTINNVDAGAVSGLTHNKFKKILKLAANRKHVYLYGAAGSGKSHTAQQVADALGLPFYVQMQLVNKYDIIGFVDAGGNYQPTPFYHAFKTGGVILFDEYERGDAAAIITLNGALANDVMTFPNGEKVTRHPDFVFISAGNTNCLGSTAEYVTACQLDQSSIDRVAFMKMNYDARLENAFSANDPTAAEFCRDLRRAVDACGVSMIVSYRAIREIAFFANDDELTKTDLLDMYLLKGRDRDTAAVLYGALQDKTNPWAVALQKYATGEIDE